MIFLIRKTNSTMKISQFKNPTERRLFLEKELQIRLEAINRAHVDNEKDIHCENFIGETTLPLGVVGPLRIQNLELRMKDYYVPLATTEGALVASVNRGCKALTLSGGVKVNTHKIGVTRGPVFYTGSLQKNQEFYEWLNKNKRQISQAAESTSSHLKFKKYDIKSVADYVFVRFYFDTENAMGMNMATIATQAIVDLIEKETGIECMSVAGNFDTDKKPTWLNFLNNRGFKTWAEGIIPEKTVQGILKTTAEKIYEVWLAKCMIGSAMSGSLGFNAHFANVVAALFAATGQDLAHVVEGSLGVTRAKIIKKGNLYISVYMPSLMVGTIGGGTKLKTKQEALSIIGAKNSEEFAEVLTGTVLAGEISLLASLAQGTLAKVHKKLGR